MKNMRREKRASKYFGLFCAAILSTILSACGGQGEDIIVSDVDLEAESITSDTDSKNENLDSSSADNDLMETEDEENIQSDTDAKDEIGISDIDPANETKEPIPNEDGSMEIYSGGEVIALSDDMIVGRAALEDILQGNPILYDRVLIDGYVVEWVLSDYEDEDNIFLEDGAVIISKEDNAENTQVINTQAEGGWGSPVSLENKFVYMDVNFDDVPDLLVCTGHHGNQGLITYYCFLQTDAGFVEAPTFTEIANPAVDTENKLILSQWRNGAASHSWAEYKYEGNAYVRYRELCEEAEGYDEDRNDIWVWTVNGEEIGRSDELSESEIEDLIYNENSEWRILDDRWRTIYNNGLNADFSIYSEP